MMPTRPKTNIIIGDSREMSDPNMLEYDEDQWINEVCGWLCSL
jgi:hypothetical protein